jgi:hypothetical protein
MKIHAAQPDKDDSQVAKVSTEDFPRYIFQVTGVTIEIVSVSVEVPNPGCGFWASCKGAVKVTWLTPLLEGSWYRVFIDYNLDFRLSLRRADCHEESPL